MAKSLFYGSSVGGDWVCPWSGALQNELLRSHDLAHPHVSAAPNGRRGCYCDLGDLEPGAVEQGRRYPTLTCSGGVRDSRSLPHSTHSAISRLSRNNSIGSGERTRLACCRRRPAVGFAFPRITHRLALQSSGGKFAAG